MASHGRMSARFRRPMIALTLNIVVCVAFGQVMKLASARHANLLWVSAFNYLAASLIGVASGVIA